MTAPPIDLAVIEFPAGPVRSELVEHLGVLVETGVIRILDLVVVAKDPSGVVTVLEIDELDEEVRIGFAGLDGEYDSLLSDDDVSLVAADAAAGSTVVLVVWENRWAARLGSDIAAAGGRIVAHERIPGDVVEVALAELDALAEADAGS